MTRLKKMKYLGLIAMTTVLLSACGQTSSKNDEEGTNKNSAAFPLTLNNYTVSSEGAKFSEKDITYKSRPTSIVANNQGTAELLLQLGLIKDMTGVAALYGEGDKTVAEDFSEIPVLSKEYWTRPTICKC